MTKWYVKDLSKLTGVSVQTLHYYDRINLLKPSIRLDNGYRVYSEKDLLQLQQIIALKFLGFELKQIKSLLTESTGALQHFLVQAQFLEQKANALLDASKALKTIISAVKEDKSIPWKMIIQLIEVYQMTQHLEHTWVEEIFTPEELKQYANFEQEMKSNSTPEQRAAFEKSWTNLVDEIKNNLCRDPESEVGIQLGEKFMRWVNGVYGKKYAHLRTKKFEKGFGEGKGLEEVGLTSEMVSWIDKAMDAYHWQRIYCILAKIDEIPQAELLKRWDELLDEVYGNDIERKKTILAVILQDKKISSKAKKWLQSL